MLAAIVRWSLDRPRLALAACLWLTAACLVVLRTAPLDLLPDLAPAEVVVQADAPGFAAEQVEQLVTRPIESGLIGAPGVAHVQSDSLQGLSVITTRLADGADPAQVRQGLAERVQTLAGALPAGVGAPRIVPMAAGAVLTLGFTSDRLDAMALRDLVEWTVRPRLLSAPGVARVEVHGGEVRRIEVHARPADLSDSDLGFLDILSATRRATSAAGAGFIDTPGQRVQIEPHGQALTPDAVGAGQIQVPGSAPVRIADVADVVEAAAPKVGDALIDGRPGVVITVARQPGANTLAVTRHVERALEVLKPALAAQGVEARADLDRPAAFIASGLHGLLLDLAMAIALIAGALALILRSLPAVLVSLVAIPLALLAAAAGLSLFGLTLNAMTLGGLAVALGVVIDDAVLDVQAILARLRAEGYGRGHDHDHGGEAAAHASRAQAVLAASLEVRGPVAVATAALALTLAPLLLLKGAAGALLAPLAAAIILANVASLAVAVAVIPGLCWLVLKHVRGEGGPAPAGRIEAAHGSLLERARRLSGVVLTVSAAMVALALVLCLQFRTELLPALHDGRLTLTVEAPPSTSIEAMGDYGARISRDLRAITGVAAVSARIGRDPDGYDSAGVEHGVFDVQLAQGLDAARQDRIAAEVSRRLELYPGLHPTVTAGANLREAAPRSGFAVGVFGPNAEAVETAAGRAAQALRSVPGAREVQVAEEAGAPTVRIDVDFQRLALYGLSVSDVLDTIQAAFQGERVARVYDGGRAIDVAVSAQDSLRRDPEAVGQLLLRSTSGVSVPLKRVAEVYLTDSRARIGHENGLMRQLVTASPVRVDAARFGRKARVAIARAGAPAGVFYEYPNDDPAAADLARALRSQYLLAAFAVVVLLAIAFDPRTCMLILAAAAVALVGGVAAIAAMGGVLSIGAIAGLIALFGLALRHAILLTARLDALVLNREAPWCWATIEQAARARLSPILTATLLIALALSPLVLHAGAPGREVLGPMAIVILAGLATSVLGSVFVLPVLVHLFWRPGYGRRARRAETPAPHGA